MVVVGSGFTVTRSVVVTGHPVAPSIPATVYVVETVGEATTRLPVGVFKDAAGDQE